MKKVFLLLAFILVGTIGFSNNVVEKSVNLNEKENIKVERCWILVEYHNGEIWAHEIAC